MVFRDAETSKNRSICTGRFSKPTGFVSNSDKSTEILEILGRNTNTVEDFLLLFPRVPELL